MKAKTISAKEITKYYDSCKIDYQLIWNLDKSHAMHFGYWDAKVKDLPRALERENEILAKRAKIKNSDVVLDAGCGVGGSSIFLAKNFGCKVVGITLSEKQTKLAKEYARKCGLDHLTKFYMMDFTNTSFPDAFFDVIWAIESICHADDKEKFINESYRLLRKTGRLIIADGFLSKNSYARSEDNIMEKWLNGWYVNFLETKNNFEFFLGKAGFKNISFLDITDNIIPSSKRLYRYSLLSVFFGKIAEFLRLRTKIQTANIIAAYYQYKALKKRLWRYGIFYGEKV